MMPAASSRRTRSRLARGDRPTFAARSCIVDRPLRCRSANILTSIRSNAGERLVAIRRLGSPLLLPSPLWGGVGGGGRRMEQGYAPRRDPPPRPSPSRNCVYAGFGHLIKGIEIGNSRFRLGEGEETAAPHAITRPRKRARVGEGPAFQLVSSSGTGMT